MPTPKSFLTALLVAPLVFAVFAVCAELALAGKFTGRRCSTEYADCKVACVAWERDRPGSLAGCRSDCVTDNTECIAGGGEASSVGPSAEPDKPDSPHPKHGLGRSPKS